jgi:hypothetical protein
MSWVSLVLNLLKLSASLITWLREKQMMQAGQDKEVARAALEVLNRTAEGKALRDRIMAMSDPEAEELWQRMIREGGG